MARNKDQITQLLKKFTKNGFGKEFPEQIVKLEQLLTDNIDQLENLEKVIDAKNPLAALQALSKISAHVEPLANFLQNFKEGKSIFDCLPLDDLEKQGLLKKQQRDAAEEAARIGRDFYEIQKKIRSSKGKDIPFDEIDDLLKSIPATKKLQELAKHVPAAQVANVQQLVKSVEKFRQDHKYYKENINKMNVEQKKQCKDGLKMEAVGLTVAGAGIAAGIGLGVAAVALAAPIPGLNIAVAGVAAAVTIGFMVYKIGHKMNQEVKKELDEGLEVTERQSATTRLTAGLREKTLGSIRKVLSFSLHAAQEKEAQSTPSQAQSQKPTASTPTKKQK